MAQLGFGVVDEIVALFWLCGFGLVLGGPVAVVCVPLLLLKRLRALFSVGPTTLWLINYVLVILLVSMGHWLLFGGVLLTGDLLFSPPGMDTPAEDGFLLWGAIGSFGTYLSILWLAPVVVLPRVGYDWDPNGDDLWTLLAVGGGVLWYQILGGITVLYTMTNLL